MKDMHKLWLVLDPRRTLVGIFVFMTLLGLLIHFLLLGTKDFNWLEDGIPPIAAAGAMTAPLNPIV